MSKVPEYVDSDVVEKLVLDKTKIPGKDYLVIDVRDEDYVNGHIPGSLNVPSTALSDKLVELQKQHAAVPKLFFHCALSQVRGPKAARIWAEGLEERKAAEVEGLKQQEVYVLRGGFVQWQRKHRDTQPTLIEGYNREYWEAEEEY
ncbi:hypothetical protein BGZ73_007697 [Actinomortierella ambigua]|nr:hypothetical protein BGZ73_007697 [Actinomortierella ambigua]